MSSILDNVVVKRKCQIFTPTSIVNEILDVAGYSQDLWGKCILENSCGDGRFLKEIVTRYIGDAIRKGFSKEVIKEGLENDIWGAELDEQQYQKCIYNINVIANSYDIDHVQWKVFNRDSLHEPFEKKFDFIVGNPPYLSYWNIPEEERIFIKGKYKSCDVGAFDYCFAFIEESINCLKETGRLVYIIPNSIFKTKAAKSIRKMLKPMLVQVIHYKSQTVFQDAVTSPAILVADKCSDKNMITYFDVSINKHTVISKGSLDDKIWIFDDVPLKRNVEGGKRFGDYFKVSSSVATQFNEAFVLSDCVIKGKYLMLKDGAKIELSAVRCAASPKGKTKNRIEYIIFPYYYEHSNLMKYDEVAYKRLFPKAYTYLSRYRDRLEKRDADRNALWYEYGRTQALGNLNKEKILVSPVVSQKVQAWKLDVETVPFSGFYITPIANMKIEVALDVLQSDLFFEYVKCVGINVNGNSIRLSTKNIEDYNW